MDKLEKVKEYIGKEFTESPSPFMRLAESGCTFCRRRANCFQYKVRLEPK